jgi:formate hydrogenlyase subunit 3/multisubunit Na+/H+ antiporter MnhD subunit
MDILNVQLQDGALAAVFFVAVFLPALAGIILGMFFRSNKVANVVASLCIVSCMAGASTYFLWSAGVDLSCTLPLPSAAGQYILSIGQLSATMISFSSVIFTLIVVHAVKSTSDSGCRYSALLNALFLACFSCMAADTALVLLMSWEMVTLVTFLLSRNGDNERARWLFFVIAHIGGMMLICAFVYISSAAGTQVLSEWRNLGPSLGDMTSTALILMIILGFGSKLGLIPFHAWMPNLYASAPIHTTALLSTVCSNVAVLVLMKSIFSYIGVSPSMSWAAFAIIALAAATALWGAMESLVQREPKKILAYSSMENMALVVLCLSLGTVYIGESPALAKLVLIAAMLHTMNHAVFKSLMLMTIDTVEDCTGETDIGKMGGLSKTLPILSVVAIVGVISMAAIPPTNGFVSEWLIIQSLMGADLESKSMSLLMPLALAAVGICGMMMAASYARLYAFVFLGRPRSEGMKKPRPMKKGTVLPMAVLAFLCLGMGFFATVFMDVLTSGIEAVTGIPSDPGYRSVMSGEMLPLLLGVTVTAVLALLLWIFRKEKRKERKTRTWGCGERLGSDMQYSSIGFSQPLVRVFHPFYGDTSVVKESKDKENKTLVMEFSEPFVKYLYTPLAAIVSILSERTGKIQTGNIQTYFGYMLATLVVALLAVRLL